MPVTTRRNKQVRHTELSPPKRRRKASQRKIESDEYVQTFSARKKRRKKRDSTTKGQTILGSPASQVNVVKPSSPGNNDDSVPHPNKAGQISEDSTPLPPKPVSDTDDIPTEANGNECIGYKSGGSHPRLESSEDKHECSRDKSEAKETIPTLSKEQKLGDKCSKSHAKQEGFVFPDYMNSDYSSNNESADDINGKNGISSKKNNDPDSMLDSSDLSDDDSAVDISGKNPVSPHTQKDNAPDSCKVGTSPDEANGNKCIGYKSGGSHPRLESSEDKRERSCRDTSEAKETIPMLSNEQKLGDKCSKSHTKQEGFVFPNYMNSDYSSDNESVDDISGNNRMSSKKDNVPDLMIDSSDLSDDDSAVDIKGNNPVSPQKDDAPDSCKVGISPDEGTAGLEDAARKKLSFETIADETKTNRRRGVNVVIIPDDVTAIKEKEIMKIEQALEKKHECFSQFRNRGEGSQFPFPKGVQFSMSIDMKFLEKRIDECTSDKELFGNYAIIDIFTQWGFLGKPEEKFAFLLPAGVYEMMNKRSSNFEQTLKLCQSTRDWDNVFDYSVITLIVWHGSHFSIAFIVNAGILHDRAKKRVRHTNNSDPAVPCILYANSMESKGAHHKDPVSKNIRSFLNKVLDSRVVNVDSMPAIDIKTCCQKDSFSCAYHSILARHAVLKSLHKRMITQSDLKNDFQGRQFNYDEGDVHKVRTGIAKLVRAIHSIKTKTVSYPQNFSALSNDEEITCDGPYFRPKERLKEREKQEEKERKAEERRKKKEMKAKEVIAMENKSKELTMKKVSVKEMRKKQNEITLANKKRKEDAMRLAGFESRMGPELNQEEKESRLDGRKRYPERMTAARCTNFQHYKDRSYRRGTHKLSKAASEFSETCRYSSETTAHMPRTQAVTIIQDMVGEMPHKSHTPGIAAIRKKKLGIAIGVNKEEFKDMLVHALCNIDDYVFTVDPHVVDNLLMGTDRMPLSQFIQRRMKKERCTKKKGDMKPRAGAQDDLQQSARKNSDKQQVRKVFPC